MLMVVGGGAAAYFLFMGKNVCQQRAEICARGITKSCINRSICPCDCWTKGLQADLVLYSKEGRCECKERDYSTFGIDNCIGQNKETAEECINDEERCSELFAIGMGVVWDDFEKQVTAKANKKKRVESRVAEPIPPKTDTSTTSRATVDKHLTTKGYYDVFNVEDWDVLNMRAGPHHKKRIVEKLAYDLKCIKRLPGKKRKGSAWWWKIESPSGKRGWVNSSYLRPNRTGCSY